MTRTFKDEFVSSVRARYKVVSKAHKQSILDELCSTCDYHRKYAIRLLNSQGCSKVSNLSKRGRKKEYDDPLILEVLHDVWVATNLPCAKRLKAIIPLWLPHYDKFIVSDKVQSKLNKISPATIDRLMVPTRSKFNKLGLATTKPGAIIKKHIPVKTNQWDETRPGFIEADTVAHCGNSTAGMFVYTVNCVDIATGWNEQRAVWGKGERGVREVLENIEQVLPFDIEGFDSDNGSEFLNWHLIRYFTDRKTPVQFTRSRPYHKNDNAHIENKNWTNIRQYLGYERFDRIELVEMLNELYTKEWSDYFNFFIPSVKLVEKQRVGSKIIKIHDLPQTPYQRIIDSEHITNDIKIELKEKVKNLNPFKLQKEMKNKIKRILKLLKKLQQDVFV